MANSQRKTKPQEFQDESVSTGYVNFGAQSLPHSTRDRQQPKFGYDEQRALRFDAEAHAAVEFVLDAILADGVETVSAVFEGKPEFELAEEISTFVRRNFLETCSFFLRTYKAQMRGAFKHGHKVGERVFRLEKQGIDQGKLVLDRIKNKPHRATAFVVDEFYNVLGLVGVRRGQLAVSTGTISSENIIPLNKFQICTFETEDEDPRGVPQTIAAFEPVCDKRETKKQYKVYLKKNAVRSFTATMPPNAKRINVFNDDGSPKIKDGVQVTKSAKTSVAETLAKMHNNTVGVFDDGTTVTAHDADGEGKQFIASLQFNGQETRKAILLQSGATGEADKGGLGKAGKEVDERVLNRRINSYRRDRELELYELSQLITALNFGEDKKHLAPFISLGDAEKSDFSALLGAYAQAGYELHESQFDEIDRKLGNPKRDMSKDSENETVQRLSEKYREEEDLSDEEEGE